MSRQICVLPYAVYHPNIDTQGRICLDYLNMPPKVGVVATVAQQAAQTAGCGRKTSQSSGHMLLQAATMVSCTAS